MIAGRSAQRGLLSLADALGASVVGLLEGPAEVGRSQAPLILPQELADIAEQRIGRSEKHETS